MDETVLEGLAAGKYLLITSYRKNGTWALVEPIGVLQFGIGVIWFPGLQALFMSTGLVLFLVGSFLSGGYRKGYLPRQPRRLYRPRGRQKLPPF
jgi:hypothetical protein